MRVPATQTIKEVKRIDVDIDEKYVLHKIYWNAMVNKPDKAEYIRDGYWYVHWFENYHKGIDVEKKDREATPEELKIYEAYNILKETL